MTAWIRRWPRTTYFLAGLGLAAAAAWALMNWYDIANDVLGLGVVYDIRPAWLRALMGVLEWLPWIVLAGLVLLRLRGRTSVRPVAFGAGAAAHYAFMVCLVLFGPTLEDRWHRQRFDSTGWQTNVAENIMWPARLTMVDDLLARHELRGLTVDSVTRLLGPAGPTKSWDGWDLIYYLGPERGLLRMDSEWLVLRLDSARRVSAYRIVRD